MKFVKQGKTASEEQTKALTDVYNDMSALRTYNTGAAANPGTGGVTPPVTPDPNPEP